MQSILLYILFYSFQILSEPSCIQNCQITPTTRNISYDHRAILIDGKRQMIIAGAIHYPRSTPYMWPQLLQKSKDAGLNAIDVYVFWDLHEPQEGIYDFESDAANLPLFLKLASQYGLFVILRLGPYICAEWDLGGIPKWVLSKPGIVIRTMNKPYLELMERFVSKTMQVITPFLGSTGGPILAMQIENEYGNVQEFYGNDGKEYIQWAADLANSFDTKIPWFMCQQDGIDVFILTCNGFYCHDWIPGHWKSFFNTPAMFTELWLGWFQLWGSAKPYRPTWDVAFASTAWIARGGSYLSYYMWHGGTNFGTWGSDWKITSYEYDAPLNEYGFPSQPKYNHLRELHNVIWFFADVILHREPIIRQIGPSVQSITFKDEDDQGVMFLMNSNTSHGYSYATRGMRLYIPEWTIMIMNLEANGQLSPVFSTSTKNVVSTKEHHPLFSEIKIVPSDISFILEPKGVWDDSKILTSVYPLEQIRTSQNASTYFWYTNSDIRIPNHTNLTLEFTHATDFVYIFLNNHLMNPQGTFDIIAATDTKYKIPSSIKVFIPESDIESITTSPQDKDELKLSILSVNMGNVNYGAHFDTVQKGIYSPLYLNGMDVTKGHWAQQIGLKGENEEYYNVKSSQPWTRLNVPSQTPFVWYRLTIPSMTLESMITTARAGLGCKGLECLQDSSFISFSLYLGSMGKGQAYVNGRSIGRYWDIKSDPNCPNTCNPGYYSPDSCLKDCGKPSQEFYHVPADWILNGQDVEIVLFEEKGGDPTLVELRLIN